MAKIDLALCWALVARGNVAAARELGLQPEMLKGEGRAVYDYVLNHFRMFGGAPAVETIREEVDLEPDSIFVPDESLEFYARRVVQRDCYNAQRESAKDMGTALRSRDPEKIHEAAKKVLQVGLDRMNIGVGRIVNQKLNREERWERYLALESSDGGVTGIRTPWVEVDDETGGYKPGDLWLYAARISVGKCVAAGTRVTCGDTGRQRLIEDVVAHKGRVLTFDQETPAVRNVQPSAWLCTGRKECLSVSTRLGEEICVTPEHPFLTSSGWVRADQLALGDLIATVAKTPEPKTVRSLPDAEVVLLAVLLSEGSYSGNHVSFSTGDDAYRRMATQACSTLGFQVKRKNKYDYAIVGGARLLLRKYGLGRERAKEKRVPAEVFSLPTQQLRTFLRAFWWGDGGVDGEICLASKGLIDDLRHLFLRFGVVGRKAHRTATCSGKKFDAWRFRVDAWCREQLLGVLGDIPGPKGRALREKIFAPTQAATDNVFVTEQMCAAFKTAAEAYRAEHRAQGKNRGLFVEAAKRLDVDCPRGWGLREFTFRNHRPQIARRVLRALLDEAGSKLSEFRWLLSDNIVFDVVTDIEPVGERAVYDLTIDGSHCFEAEHLVVHNTWAAILSGVRAGQQNRRVGFVSPEMSRSSLEMRRDAVLYGLPYRHLRRGQLDFEMKERYRACLLEQRDEPDWLIACDGRVRTLVDLDLFAQETGVDMLIVDGAYMLHSGTDKMPWQERMMLIFRQMKDIAIARRIPVVATSQFNRTVRTGAQRAGTEALAFTDAAGQYADVIMGMFRNEDQRREDQMAIRQLKNREGVPIELLVTWDLDTMDFSTVAVQGGGDDEHEGGGGSSSGGSEQGGGDGGSLFH